VAVVYQTDKRSGITYAYQSISYWDKAKKQSRAKRTLIGRVDSVTGEIVPTDGRNRKNREGTVPVSRDLPTAAQVRRSFYGATYLLDAIGETLGVTHDLQRCFPDTYKQILSIAYYLILEDSTPLYRFEKWDSLHKHPYGKPITSQRSSELFASITEKDKYRFFTLQGKRRPGQEFWAYDTTTLSSYSETLRQVQYGHIGVRLILRGGYLPSHLRLLFHKVALNMSIMSLVPVTTTTPPCRATHGHPLSRTYPSISGADHTKVT